MREKEIKILGKNIREKGIKNKKQMLLILILFSIVFRLNT